MEEVEIAKRKIFPAKSGTPKPFVDTPENPVFRNLKGRQSTLKVVLYCTLQALTLHLAYTPSTPSTHNT
jgi:hypothetical protein